MEEKEEVLDDLIDNTELDHAESNVLRQSSFPDWDLVVKPTPKLNSEDVTTGTISTDLKQSLMDMLQKYKKVIPENTSDIGKFSYFRANFGIQKNKTAYGTQRPILNDPSLDQCVKNLVDGKVICLSDSPIANSFVTNPVAVLKPTTNI